MGDELDINRTGLVSLDELDAPTAHKLETLVVCAMRRSPTWAECWRTTFDVRGDDRVNLRHFIVGCLAIGYAGDAESLFRCLDMDSAGYLTLEGTQWIAGEEEALGPTNLFDDPAKCKEVVRESV